MASAKRSDDFDMIELRVSSKNPYLSKDYDFAFADIRSSYSSVLLGIYKNEKLYKNPTKPITISENDYLVIMTNGDGSSKLKKDFGVEEGRF
jgi:K+/H+ antiporter YhaU regulatory subunit KhtT